jgi:hypothetical protein
MGLPSFTFFLISFLFDVVISSSCLGPPYLLATFHGGSGKNDINQVVQYSRDGCVLNQNVLNIDGDLRSLRGMALFLDGKLSVNNAYKDDSAVLYFDACDDKSSTRDYLETITGSLVDDDGGNVDYYLLHPYGAAYYDSRVYITNQDSCTITSYSEGGGDEHLIASFYPCNVEDSSTSELRGIVFDNSGAFYVAFKQEDVILIYNATSKAQLGTKKCKECIGLTYDSETDTIFAGSNDDDHVYQYEVWPSMSQVNSFHHSSKLQHPAGLAVHNGTLYVGSQNTARIVHFDVASTDYLGTVVSDLDDTIEDLILSPC